MRAPLYKSRERPGSEATPGCHGVQFSLRVTCLKHSKSSLISANGLLDLNQNLDTAVNYVPRKRLSLWFTHFPITRQMHAQ